MLNQLICIGCFLIFGALAFWAFIDWRKTREDAKEKERKFREKLDEMD